MTFRLETDRLFFRELHMNDLDPLAAMMTNPLVMQYYPKPLSKDEAREWILRQRKRYDDDGHGLWALIHRETGTFLGQIGLVEQEVDGAPETEIGYMLDEPYWRQGFAREAGTAVRDHGFETLGRSRLISLCRPENKPSCRTAESLGMSLDKETNFKGFPHLVYAVERPD